MTALYQGVFDANIVAFSIPDSEVAEIRKAVDKLIPGASDDFIDICKHARHLRCAHTKNQVAQTRREIANLLKHLNSTKTSLESVNPFVNATLGPEFSVTLDDLIARAEHTQSIANNLPEGKQPLSYRNYLAVQLARLMVEHQHTPTAVSYIDSKKKIQHNWTYHDLFKNGIRLVDGVITDRVYEYLKHGIDHCAGA